MAVRNSQKLLNGRVLRLRTLRIDVGKRLLLRDGESLPITARVFDTLLALVENRGRLVGKDELMRLVWPDTVVEESNLSQHVFQLRRLLEEGPRDHRYIATVARHGYRFVADVQEDGGPTVVPALGRPAAAVGVSPTSSVATHRFATRLTMRLGSVPLAVSGTVPFALSPDGRCAAYVGTPSHGMTRIYLRHLKCLETSPIAGTDGAANPFFSPDGEWLGFFAEGQLKKVAIAGGPPLAICDAGAESRGAVWTTDHDIIYSPAPAAGLWRVSASGGAPRQLTFLDFDRGERTHRWPESLPDGWVLFTVGRAGVPSFDDATLVAHSIATGERHVVLEHASFGRYLASGHLLYTRGGTLMAVSFDSRRLCAPGPTRSVLTGVLSQPTGAAYFDCSKTGTLVYAAGEALRISRKLVWVDAGGRTEELSSESYPLEEPRLAPHGAAIALGISGKTNDIWLYDVARASLARMTFEGDNFAPIWTPDGDRLTFSSNESGPSNIFWKAVDEIGEQEQLIVSEFDEVPGSWSPDGRYLFYTQYHPDTGADLWLFSRDDGCRSTPFLRTRFNEYGPMFAPDGRSVAYTSDESGRREVYVVGFPQPRGKRQISTSGGTEPVWSRDGRFLYFRVERKMMRVRVTTVDGALAAAAPEMVFEGDFLEGAITGLPNYDVAADGERFLMVTEGGSAAPDELVVAIDWQGELNELVPPRQY